jgi:Ni/Co efflux regulator RcnB
MKRLILSIILTLVLPLAAHAGHGNGKGYGNHNAHFNGENDRQGHGMSIIYHDRVIIEDYLEQHPGRKHCPPGLAKKHNGCLPPGQAKKYRIGERLPRDISWAPLPEQLLVRLNPPRGYKYIQVDKDVLLIGEATKKVIDAVELLSAVGD